MTNRDDLEKRIENLEREVQHLKEALQYQAKNKKTIWQLIKVKITANCII